MDERSVQLGDEADAAWRGGGRAAYPAVGRERSRASWSSAMAAGAPPPDQRPAPDGRRQCARSIVTAVSGLVPAPVAAPWLRFG